MKHIMSSVLSAWLLVPLYSGASYATEPTDPVQIITPEESAFGGEITRNFVRIISETENVGISSINLLLYQQGKLLREQRLNPSFEKVEMPLNPDAKSHKENGGAPAVRLVAEIEAVPEELWREVEKGVYAHQLEVIAKLPQGELVVSDWVRWETNGERVRLLDAETYDSLTEARELTKDAQGRPIMIFTGIDLKIDEDDRPQKIDFETRVDEGAVPEQELQLKEFELENQFDEREED